VFMHACTHATLTICSLEHRSLGSGNRIMLSVPVKRRRAMLASNPIKE
jgi:hypothetical protein